MNLNFDIIKTIISDKLKGKSDIQRKIDILQTQVIDHIQNFNYELSADKIKDLVLDTFNQLIAQGKLIVDATGVIIDSNI